MRYSQSFVGLGVFASSAAARPPDRVHSDLPLFLGRQGELQPMHFSDGESFGCSSRVAFGDWKFVEPIKGSEPYVEWLRLRNYGVFHCAVIEQWADHQKRLEATGSKHSWFVDL